MKLKFLVIILMPLALSLTTADTSSNKEPKEVMVTVDLVTNGSEIDVYDHKTGKLLFEYSKYKKADWEAYKELGDIIDESIAAGGAKEKKEPDDAKVMFL